MPRSEEEKKIVHFVIFDITGLPNVLNPHIATGSKEQPLNWQENVTGQISDQGNKYKKYREKLQRETNNDGS
jgi:hypothetical protein